MWRCPIRRTKAECAAILEKAGERAASLAALVQKGEPFPEAAISFKDRMNSGPVNGLFYALFVHDKGFAASEACVSAANAPSGAAEQYRHSDGKPVWNGNCTHCMACIGGCPTEAIEYKSASKGNRRYYIMKD